MLWIINYSINQSITDDLWCKFVSVLTDDFDGIPYNNATVGMRVIYNQLFLNGTSKVALDLQLPIRKTHSQRR